jgi:UDP-N-acetyl-D-mannosaminuronic acid dehydrogenase
VGLPLGVRFAQAGAGVLLLDINRQAVEMVNRGRFPFLEKGGEKELRAALAGGMRAVSDPAAGRGADAYIIVTGTPVDEHLNPKLDDVLKVFDIYKEYFRPGSLVIMRSTLFPGTMDYLRRRLARERIKIKLAFCPERVAQGAALEEISSLPQIVSAFDEKSFRAACKLFARIAPAIIRLAPLEAELAKLMTNAWRYLEFAIANQFYIIAESNGVDFHKIFEAMRYEYPRSRGYKSPGFTAGPCLFKDTMQLASYFEHQFYLGHSAMLVNEGLAMFAVKRAGELLGGLKNKTIGLLGMSFKAGNDDTRESLSFRVKKTLEFQGASVIFHDPYVAGGVPLSCLVTRADALILCTPHAEYARLKTNKPVVDIWGFIKKTQVAILPGLKKTGRKTKKGRSS